MRRRFILITSVLCALLIPVWLASSQTKSQPKWKSIGSYYHRENEVEMFYDAETIKYVSEKRVQIWIKQIEHYEDDKAKQVGLEELRENRRFLKLSLDGYDKFAFSTSLIEFDCQEKAARNLCFVDYDEMEKVIGKKCLENFPFAPVMTEITKKLLDLTCKQK